jgi:hypothetical protein
MTVVSVVTSNLQGKMMRQIIASTDQVSNNKQHQLQEELVREASPRSSSSLLIKNVSKTQLYLAGRMSLAGSANIMRLSHLLIPLKTA